MRSFRSLVALLALIALAVPVPAAAAGGSAGTAPPEGLAGTPTVGSTAPMAGWTNPAIAGLLESASNVTLVGTFQAAVTDGDPGGPRTFYWIDTDAGAVVLDVSGGDVSTLSGASVELRGSRKADGSVAVSAAAIRVLAPAPRDSLGATPAADGVAQPDAATRKVAVIIGRWSDETGSPVYPVTVAEAQQAFTTDATSVHNYFAATSRGNLTMDATVVGAWPLGISQCQGGDFELFDATIAAAVNAASAHGVSLSSYQHVFVWVKPPTRSGCTVGWAGMGQVPGRYVMMVMNRDPYGWPWGHAQVAAHELNHNLGLYHSNGLMCWSGSSQVALGTGCQSGEYADQYSTMGIAGAPINVLLDADRLDSFGWLAPTEKQTLTAVGTYSLVPTYSSSPGIRLIRIPHPDPVVSYSTAGGYWTLEIRSTPSGGAFDQFTAYAPALAATTGVTIRFSQDGLGYSTKGYSQLVDNTPTATNPPGMAYEDYWDAPLQPGHTFTDAAGGFTITVDSVSGAGATVTIGDTKAPGAPPSLTASALSPHGAGLVWTAASDNLGLALYRVYRDGSQIAEVSAATLTYTDATVNGGFHTYGVTAVDTAANESPAATDDVVTTGEPGAPTAVVAVAGNGAAQVSWTAPNDYGSPITGYTVTSAPEGRTCTTTLTWCVVEGLTNGTPYTFTVIATNAVGAGPASGASNSVTPTPAVPGRPTGASAVPGNASAAVSWTAPADAGSGGPITHYDVTSTPGNRTCATPDGSTTTCTVTGLANGTAYVFSVTATNSLGTGVPSLPSASVTPRTVPNAPTAVTAVGTNGAATVTWTAPFNGGAAIDGYLVTASPGGATCTTGGALTCSVPGLTNRSPYTFKVAAHNIVGYGAASSDSPPATPAAGGTYFTVTPNRLVDSRAGTRLGLAASLTHGTSVSFQVTGRFPSDATRNIPANAIAVTGNLTAVNESFRGYFALTPDDPPGDPTTSTVNFPRGDTRANAVTVPLGSGGRLWVTYIGAAGAHADIIFDVTGYFVANTGGASYLTVTPNRLVDSRAGTRLGLAASLTHGTSVSFQVTGRFPSDATRNIPANAIAVTGNLTAVNEGWGGYYALTPDDPPGDPTTSTVNFPKGDTRANAVTVPLGSGGRLWVTYIGTAGTHADVIFDVTGYFVAGTSGATYLTVTPSRLVDSRAGTRLGLAASLTHPTSVSFQATGRFPSDATRNIPTTALAVTGNLTAVNESFRGYFALTPDDPPGDPTTSTVNFPTGDTRANAVTVPLGGGGVLWVTYIGAAGAHADVIFDVTGYFTME